MEQDIFYPLGIAVFVILSGLCIYFAVTSARIKRFNKSQKNELEKAFQHADEMVKSFFGGSLKSPIDMDIKTIEYLEPEYIEPGKLSQVNKYSGRSGNQLSDFYRIAINDNEVLKKLKDRPDMALLPFLTYIVTQQYVLIVKFTNFGVPFDQITESRKLEETRQSHLMTFEILEKYNLMGREPVFAFFEGWTSIS